VRDGQRPGYSLVLPREDVDIAPATTSEEE